MYNIKLMFGYRDVTNHKRFAGFGVYLYAHAQRQQYDYFGAKTVNILDYSCRSHTIKECCKVCISMIDLS